MVTPKDDSQALDGTTSALINLSEPLPSLCMRCGAPAEYHRTVIFKHNIEVSGADDWALVGCLTLFITFVMPLWVLFVPLFSDIGTRRVQIEVPLCGRHRFHFFLKRTMNALVVVPLLCGILLTAVFQNPWPGVAGLVLMLVSLPFPNLIGIRAVTFGLRTVKLAGVSLLFAQALKPSPSSGKKEDPENPWDFST